MTDHRETLQNLIYDTIVDRLNADYPRIDWAVHSGKQFRAELPDPFFAVFLGPTIFDPQVAEYVDPQRASGALLGYQVTTSFVIAEFEEKTAPEGENRITLFQMTQSALAALEELLRNESGDTSYVITGVGPPEDEFEDVADAEQEQIELDCIWQSDLTLRLRNP